MSEQRQNNGAQEEESKLVREIFDDFESRSNFVGLFNLLLKIDRRVNPHLYKQQHD